MVVVNKNNQSNANSIAMNKKNPTLSSGIFTNEFIIKFFYALTFPFTFAITSSAIFVGAGA